MFATYFLASSGLVVAALLLTHAKVKSSSVLVHFATHNLSLKSARVNRWSAQWLSIITLGIPFDEYGRVHSKHHRDEWFASLKDEEAASLVELGFRPGLSRMRLWVRFWWTLVSPNFHATQLIARLRLNFVDAPLAHVAAAWAFWGVVAGALMYANMATAFVIGALVPLIVGGNIGSFLELISRHFWMITPRVEKRRQRELSHGRFIAPPLPAKGSSWLSYIKWAGAVGAATAARLAIIPGDLAWHHAHHNGLPLAPERKGHRAWPDAASAYSYHLYQDHTDTQRNYLSIRATIDAWFDALSREPRC